MTALIAAEASEAVRLGGEIYTLQNRLGIGGTDRTRQAIYDYMSVKLGRLSPVDLWGFGVPHPANRGDLVPEPYRA